MSKQIVIFSATSGSNLKLAETLKEHAQKLGAMVQLINLESAELPLYTPAAEGKGIPGQAMELILKLEPAGGFIFCAPEYNGSIPPVVINAISWMSRSGKDDWRGAFNGKFAVVATHSGGGGAKVCAAMKQLLEHLGSVVLPRPIITNYQKELNSESADAILGQLLKYC